ncbi:hypothetical protein M9Y10_008884 [Tritrichomonas musculus]|uniref:Uncharacterized protein n=1 Tax=Tritrichomonas musculus TaxID=1915356 RepID=A0ABR2J0A9_9EUKA
MSTPSTGRKSAKPTPARTISEGNEDLAALMSSKKGIIFVITVSIILTVVSIIIFNTLGNKATTIWGVIVVVMLFAVRHFLGNVPTKINNID